VDDPGRLPRPDHVDPVALSTLASDAQAQLDGDDVSVTGITATSSWIRPGDLFAAVPGRATHGARFASDAADRGAVAVLTDSAGREFVPAGVPTVVVPDVRSMSLPPMRTIWSFSRAIRVVRLLMSSTRSATSRSRSSASAGCSTSPRSRTSCRH